MFEMQLESLELAAGRVDKLCSHQGTTKEPSNVEDPVYLEISQLIGSMHGNLPTFTIKIKHMYTIILYMDPRGNSDRAGWIWDTELI